MKTAEEIVREKSQKLISAPSDTTIDDALHIMLKNRIGAIFIEENNNYVGVWTERDLVRNATEENFNPKKALLRDYMTRDLETAPHTDTTYTLMEKFRKMRIRHLLIEKFGIIIGLISPGDVMVEKNKEIESLNSELQKNIEELNSANRQIKLSEEKYRLLVEGSNDIIFTLDENWNFITANKALTVYFKIAAQDIASRNFIDLIHEKEGEKSVVRHLIKRKLIEFAQERKPVQFYAEFKSPKIIEPRRMVIRLEYINVPGKNEILGKAADVVEDQLLQFFEFEQKRFVIPNSLLAADDITRRLTHNLQRFMDWKDINYIRIALREIIINAIEHGNLHITYKDKEKAMENDEYFKLIRTRNSDPAFMNKKVHIEYMINETKAMYKITDEGDGFDHEKYLSENFKKAETTESQHGRGIVMAKNIFDEIHYNKKGNQVLLLKKFKGEQA